MPLSSLIATRLRKTNQQLLKRSSVETKRFKSLLDDTNIYNCHLWLYTLVLKKNIFLSQVNKSFVSRHIIKVVWFDLWASFFWARLYLLLFFFFFFFSFWSILIHTEQTKMFSFFWCESEVVIFSYFLKFIKIIIYFVLENYTHTYVKKIRELQ